MKLRLVMLSILIVRSYTSDLDCGTCVCAKNDIRPTSEVLQGRPGKQGPTGIKGERGVPGEPDEKLVDTSVDKKMRFLTDEIVGLRKSITEQNSEMELLKEQLNTLLLVHQPRDCFDILKASGIQRVYPPFRKRGIDVFCDQKTDDGGWTVIQRRVNGSVDFYRQWDAYVKGFGNLDGEFWLGLDNINQFSSYRQHHLRVDIEDFRGNRAYAQYSSFRVDDASTEYTLTADEYTGDAGNALSAHTGMKFSTSDRDNDKYDDNCAVRYNGAWWYNKCHYANLNGKYHFGGKQTNIGITWRPWYDNYYSMKSVEMKIRPS